MTNDIKSIESETQLSNSDSFNKEDKFEMNTKKNVISMKTVSELPFSVQEIRDLLIDVLEKLENNEINPEFRALMEAYVNKANEAEELKVNLSGIAGRYEQLKSEINQLRETNRNLISELQSAREALKKLELELNSLEEVHKLSDNSLKEKITELNRQKIEYENKFHEYEARTKQFYEEKLKMMQEIENKFVKFAESHEKSKQELLDQNFKLRQSEQELSIAKDNLQKQVHMLEKLLSEQTEELELKTKEVEYKEAILNQLIKQKTLGKLNFEDINYEIDAAKIKDNNSKKYNLEVLKEKEKSNFLSNKLFKRLTKD